jgi:23S rRNA G2445 N2-methylase RlmL
MKPRFVTLPNEPEILMNIFALTTRGLEAVSAGEMAAVPGLRIVETGYRRVAAYFQGSPASLLALRTVDDLYIDLATWREVIHTRDMLATVKVRSAELDFAAPTRICAQVRMIGAQPLFSVTASFVGRRNYSADEIKQAVAEGVSRSIPWTYTADDREADFNIRVFIEHETAYVGLRLSKSPLHERRYKQVQRAGSLKPSVAAAMLQLAEAAPGDSLLDPCCGAGTILIEGALIGTTASGGDIDPEAVDAARANADAANVNIDIREWDARRLPIPDRSIDRIVTNLPWGRQIVVDQVLADFYRDVCAEMERVLAHGGRIAILTSTPHLLHFESMRLERAMEISLFGQKPTLVIFRGHS